MLRFRFTLSVLCALILLSVTSVCPAIAQRYRITDLGILPDKTTASAFCNNSINNAGQVVGWCNNGDFIEFQDNVPFLWSQHTGMQPLPQLPGVLNASAFALNDHGQVVGVVGGENGTNFLISLTQHAVLWSEGAVYDLGTLPGDTTSYPFEINNRGQVVGISLLNDGNTNLHARPVVWENGQIRQLPSGGTDGAGGALGINQKGQIVGTFHTADPADPFHTLAVLWSKRKNHYDITLLGSLGGDWTHPFAINDKRQIAGYGATPLGEVHVFFWEDGVMTDLGTLGGTYSAAWDMNNKGQAVGSSTTFGDLELHAALYEDGGVIDLNDLIPANSGWLLIETGGINERGQIAGYGLHNGELRSFLLTPKK